MSWGVLSYRVLGFYPISLFNYASFLLYVFWCCFVSHIEVCSDREYLKNWLYLVLLFFSSNILFRNPFYLIIVQTSLSSYAYCILSIYFPIPPLSNYLSLYFFYYLFLFFFLFFEKERERSWSRAEEEGESGEWTPQPVCSLTWAWSHHSVILTWAGIKSQMLNVIQVPLYIKIINYMFNIFVNELSGI